MTNLLLLALLFNPVSTIGYSAEDYEKTIEEKFLLVSDSLHFFSTPDFLCNQMPWVCMEAKTKKEYCDLLRSCVSFNPYRWQDYRFEPYGQCNYICRGRLAILKKLANHPDAGVRTLALADLFHSESLEAFEEIVCHIDDQAPTWPTPAKDHLSIPASCLFSEEYRMTLYPQTVGDVAQAMLNFAGWTVNGSPPDPISWMAFRVRRASQNSIPQLDFRGRLMALFNEAGKMPSIQQELCMLHVFATEGMIQLLGNERQLIFAARRLGPDRLLEWLQIEEMPEAPNLRLSWETSSFLLSHADKIFRADDAESILQLARQRQGAPFYLAAASLQPKNAVPILREGLLKLPSYEWKHDLFWQLWCAGGPAEEDFCIARFYGEKLSQGRSPARSLFVRFLLNRFQSQDRDLLARIIKDERFNDLDWATLQEIAKGLNSNCLHPVVSPQSIVNSRHPTGMSHFYANLEESKKKFPDETKQLLDTLQQWRVAIRDSLPTWNR